MTRAKKKDKKFDELDEEQILQAFIDNISQLCGHPFI